MKRREISLMNALLCFQVIFVHVSSALLSREAAGEWWYETLFALQYLFIYAVPGFVLLAGIKLGRKIARQERFRYFPYLWGRIKRVTLPYLFWSAVYYVYLSWFSPRGGYPWELGTAVGYVLRGDMAAHFYFVPLIMQFYLLAPLWVYLIKRCRPELLCTAAALVTMCAQYIPAALAEFGVYFGSNDTLFPAYLLYWMLGLCIGCDYDRFCARLAAHRPALAVLAALAAGGYICIMRRQLGLGGENVPYGESARILASAALCTAVFALCLGARGKRGPVLAAADGASYNVYLAHCLFLFLLEDHWTRTLAEPGIGEEFFLRFAAALLPAAALSLGWYGIRRLMTRRRKELMRI